jgi:hypothetical protein
MFREDFLNIFHHGNGRSGKSFDIETNDNDLAARLLTNVETRDRRGRADERLLGLIEEIAQSLVWYGRAFYFIRDHDGRDEIDIISMSSENIFKIAGNIIQYCPSRLEGRGDGGEDRTSREVRFLDRRKILHFTWPASVRRKITSQNKVLVTLDKHDSAVAIGFQPQVTHENPNPHTNFDFKQWREAHDLALYRATRETGWNGRKYDSEKRSDFFDCHRLIRFRRMQLSIRDNILTQLSSELTKAGRHYSENFRMEVSTTDQLPSISQLDAMEASLSREELSFKEVIEFCFRS